MAAIEPYKFKPNVLQTQNVIAEKIVKWIISCMLQVFLLAATFELDGMTSNQTRPGCQVRRATLIFWTSFETKLFRIAGTSILEAETSNVYLLQVKTKSKRFGVTFSFNRRFVTFDTCQKSGNLQ